MKKTVKLFSFLFALSFLLFSLFYYFYFWWYSYFYFPPSLNPRIVIDTSQTTPMLKKFAFEIQEFKTGEDKVYLFLPKREDLDSAPIILFFHGLNTGNDAGIFDSQGLIHLVQRGNILIIPIYEKGLLPLFRSKELLKKAEDLAGFGISKVKEIVPQNDFSKFAILGFSLGGAVATHFSFEKFQRTKALILIAPAETFPLFPPHFFGVSFEVPEKIPEEVFLVGILADKDRIVNFKKVKNFFLKSRSSQKYLFRISSDNYGFPPLISNHSNIFFTSDFLNINGVFTLIDKTLECAFENKNCQIFEEKSIFLGKWSDGKEIRRIVQIELK